VVENNSQEIRIRGFDPQHHRRRGSPVYSLELGVGELSRDGVAVLAGLPDLVHLDLSIGGAPTERAPSTMPCLHKLKLEFNAHEEQGGWCGSALAGVMLAGCTWSRTIQIRWCIMNDICKAFLLAFF